MEQIRYPIGQFQLIKHPTPEDRNRWIGEVRDMPQILRQTVHNLTEEQLHRPYRPGGWTVCQVVHHMADNDMNAYIRFTVGLLPYFVHYIYQIFRKYSRVPLTVK